MPCRLRLVLCLHDHQPVGNFDGVFEAAVSDLLSAGARTVDAALATGSKDPGRIGGGLR